MTGNVDFVGLVEGFHQFCGLCRTRDDHWNGIVMVEERGGEEGWWGKRGEHCDGVE